MDALLVIGLVLVLFVVITIMRSVRDRASGTRPQRRAARPLPPDAATRHELRRPLRRPGLPMMELREQVVSFPPQPVITEDNLVVEIDTVLYFQVTDPRSAAYEIANYLQAVEQLTVTTLRNVVGSMDLEQTLTSRDDINSRLRGVLDEATGRWGLRVNRVEIKAIDPPKSIKDAMEKQMRAERDKRATVIDRRRTAAVADPHRRGRQAGRDPARRGAAGRGDPRRPRSVQAIDEVFQAVHRNDPDPKVLAYQYLQMLPELANGQGNTFWVIPSEFTAALDGVTR